MSSLLTDRTNSWEPPTRASSPKYVQGMATDTGIRDPVLRRAVSSGRQFDTFLFDARVAEDIIEKKDSKRALQQYDRTDEGLVQGGDLHNTILVFDTDSRTATIKNAWSRTLCHVQFDAGQRPSSIETNTFSNEPYFVMTGDICQIDTGINENRYRLGSIDLYLYAIEDFPEDLERLREEMMPPRPDVRRRLRF